MFPLLEAKASVFIHLFITSFSPLSLAMIVMVDKASLRRNANDTASRPAASIARLLALVVAALAEVVGAGVHDDGAAQHALGPDQLHHLVRDAAFAVALSVGLEVA